jgi:uncharacterized protein (TIGR00369 family)
MKKGIPLHPNPAYMKELIDVVNRSPYPVHMRMKLTSIGLDTATIELNLGVCHLQPYGIVHGGVLATLIDTATFWSVYMRIPEGDGLVNVDLKLNYLLPVDQGILRAEGKAIRSGKSIGYAESKVFNEKEELVAHGTSTLLTLPGKGLKMRHQKFISSNIHQAIR